MEVRDLVKPAASAAPDACDGDALMARMRAMWAGVANGWGQHADYADVRGAKVTEWMLDEADVRAGDRVLELACGAGGPGLAAAERVGRDGMVVLSDFVPEMTAIAAARAAARGLCNVETRVIDAQRIAEPDGSFDVVLCREGLMLMPDPAAAAREMHRVLKPGGRVAVAVWGPRAGIPGWVRCSTWFRRPWARRCRRRAYRIHFPWTIRSVLRSLSSPRGSTSSRAPRSTRRMRPPPPRNGGSAPSPSPARSRGRSRRSPTMFGVRPPIGRETAISVFRDSLQG